MLTEEQLVERLQNVACPDCFQVDYELRMRCDLGLGECLYVASCHHCGHQFDFENIAEFNKVMLRIQHNTHERRCPVCGETELEAHFVCDLRKHECYAHTVCSGGHFERRAEGLAAAMQPW